MTAEGDQPEQKRDIFQVFFSYFPQDMALLSPESEIAMGVVIVT